MPGEAVSGGGSATDKMSKHTTQSRPRPVSAHLKRRRSQRTHLQLFSRGLQLHGSTPTPTPTATVTIGAAGGGGGGDGGGVVALEK